MLFSNEKMQEDGLGAAQKGEIRLRRPPKVKNKGNIKVNHYIMLIFQL